MKLEMLLANKSSIAPVYYIEQKVAFQFYQDMVGGGFKGCIRISITFVWQSDETNRNLPS